MAVVELEVRAPNCLRQTCVNNSYVISTVFLHKELAALDSLIVGITEIIGDMGRADLGAIGDYETMVFPGTNASGITDWTELDFRRYESEDEAHEGHADMVAKWEEMPLDFALSI